MTTYTFVPNSSSYIVDWGTASIWSGGVAPNDASADVVFPAVTYANNSASYYISTITVTSAYTVNSISITENRLSVDSDGGLTIGGALEISDSAEVDIAGTLSAGSVVNDGRVVLDTGGTLTLSRSLQNEGSLDGSGSASLTLSSFDNDGALIDLTLNVTPGGFGNLSGSTLTGGAYEGTGSNLYLNVGGVMATDAASITLSGGGEVEFYNSDLSAYQTVETMLTNIAWNGALTLGAGETDSWGNLTVDGLLKFQGASSTFGQLTLNGLLLLEGGAPTFTQLNVDAGGVVMGDGVLNGPIVDNGTIVSGLWNPYLYDSGQQSSPIDGLKIMGPITGSGTLQIAPTPKEPIPLAWAGYQYYPWALELGAAASANVVFADGHGTLILDDPQEFTGTIAPGTGGGAQIELSDVLLSSVTGYSYVGDTSHGTLTLDLSGGSQINLNLVGDYATASFSLSGTAQTLSTDPQYVVITDNAAAATPTIPVVDQIRDNFQESEDAGGGTSEILIENTAGSVVVGQIIGGQEVYSTLAGLGPEWKLVGAATSFSDTPYDEFLMENSAGSVVAAGVSYFAPAGVTYSHVANLGPEWSFHGTGDYLGTGADEYLIENTSGSLVLGGQFTNIGGIGPEWTIEGSGGFLGDGKAQFLMENTAGVVQVGEVVGGQAQYTSVAGLGPEWKFVGTGDFLGDGKSQFLIENTAGSVALGEVEANHTVQFTTLAGLGSEWTFVGAGRYLAGELHDEFMIRNTNGALVVGDYIGGHVTFSQVGALGSEWSFHG